MPIFEWVLLASVHVYVCVCVRVYALGDAPVCCLSISLTRKRTNSMQCFGYHPNANTYNIKYILRLRQMFHSSILYIVFDAFSSMYYCKRWVPFILPMPCHGKCTNKDYSRIRNWLCQANKTARKSEQAEYAMSVWKRKRERTNACPPYIQ